MNTGRAHILLFFIASLLVLISIVIKYQQQRPFSFRINTTVVRAEVADSQEEITQGLSGRTVMSANPNIQGMLFILPERKIPTFWMKDMQFPLDFIWIDKQLVVDVSENIPVPDNGKPLNIYSPQYPVTHVLEVPAGFVKERNIKVGDVVKWQE